ncbi:MAG: hypothetical protein Q8O04_04310 [Deltaproteobacteria bacterium]|nr:hypothetical protein [Deltaproteobacteria bacterium]
MKKSFKEIVVFMEEEVPFNSAFPCGGLEGQYQNESLQNPAQSLRP